MHSHWGTRRGYPFQTPEELAQQERVFKSTPRYVSEAEMAEHFRKTSVRVMLDLGVRMSQSTWMPASCSPMLESISSLL